MTKLELFIKEKSIQISTLEDELGLKRGTIRIGARGIPEKHTEAIIEILVKDYGYSPGNDLNEVDEPKEPPKKIWNENFIPTWKDGIKRYRDLENGIWKRLSSWQERTDKKTGEIILNEDYKPINTEIKTDNIGRHYIAKNGIKVYLFEK